jgi:hypothetical protein
MTDQDAEAANQSARHAAGPPPGDQALKRSFDDEPKGYLRTLMGRVTDFVGGGSSHSK